MIWPNARLNTIPSVELVLEHVVVTLKGRRSDPTHPDPQIVTVSAAATVRT